MTTETAEPAEPGRPGGLRTWQVSTDATCWRSVTVQAETMEEAMRLAEQDSQQWGDDQELGIQFSNWTAGEIA